VFILLDSSDISISSLGGGVLGELNRKCHYLVVPKGFVVGCCSHYQGNLRFAFVIDVNVVDTDLVFTVIDAANAGVFSW
jgi:hypothetical protein